jgi:hypothetical protein
MNKTFIKKGVAKTEAIDLQRKRINQFTGLNIGINEFIEQANTVEIVFDIGYLSFKDLFDIQEGKLTIKIGRLEQMLVEGNNRFAKSTLISADFRRFLILNYFETLQKDGFYEEYLIEAFTAYKTKHNELSGSLLKLQKAERSLVNTNNAKNLLSVKSAIEQVKNELERVYFDLITLAHLKQLPIQEVKLMLVA